MLFTDTVSLVCFFLYIKNPIFLSNGHQLGTRDSVGNGFDCSWVCTERPNWGIIKVTHFGHPYYKLSTYYGPEQNWTIGEKWF